MLSEAERAAVADRLHAAERDRAPIPPLTEEYPNLDAADAYRIQLHNIRRRTLASFGDRSVVPVASFGDRSVVPVASFGDRSVVPVASFGDRSVVSVVGHKVGLSSLAMQQMMGVDEPDYGHLLADMRLFEDEPVAAGRYCYPRVEVEVGFVLGRDLPGDDCTESDVLAATEAFAPAIELIDSRIVDWRISLADTIADNASSAGFVLGEARVDPSTVDVRAIGAVLRRDGEEVARGRSDAVLGDPTTAVAWLARTVAGFGVRLRAGHIILPGACARAVDARPGDDFQASFDGLGDVSLSFV